MANGGKPKKIKLSKESRFKPFPLIRKAIANRLYRTIAPDVYGFDRNVTEKAQAFLGNVPRTKREDPYSEDAWAKYLGLQQPQGSITESPTRPSVGSGRGKYHRLPEEFEQQLLSAYQSNRDYLLTQSDDPRRIPMAENMMAPGAGRVLGQFTVGEGEDERGRYLSYYDKYDLAPSAGALPPKLKKLLGAGETFQAEKVFGEPFEFYNRIYYKDGGQMTKSKIYIKPSKRGTFTAAAKKRGKGVQEFARQVLANKENYSSAMVKKANFARNAAKWNKKADGGYIYEPLPEESLGGILGEVAKGAGSGALGGSAVPGLGTGIGAIIGGATGLIKGLFGHRQEKLQREAQEAEAQEQQKLLEQQQAEQSDLAEQERRDTMVQSKLKAMPQAPVYAPVVANGGLLPYSGPSHAESPSRGIPVDKSGNPVNVTNQNPVALVEGGEIARYQPDGNVFIYSKKSGHAKQAAKIQKNFQKALGKDLNGPDKMAKEAMNMQLDALAEEQEALKQYKCGGKMHREDGGPLLNYKCGGKTRYADGGKLPEYQLEGLLPMQNIPAPAFGPYGVDNPTGYQAPLTGIGGLGVTEEQQQYNPYLSNLGIGDAGGQSQAGGFGGGFNFGNLLSPVGHILSGLAATRDYNRLRREPVEEVDLGPDIEPATIAAEQVSFAPERAIAREQATTGSAVAARTARNLGLSGAQTAATIGGTRLGIQRALGQQLGTSVQKEAITNAQMRQQAALANQQARQQSRLTNAQLRGQQGIYNAMLRNQYREQLRQADPLSNWLRIGAGYLGENVAYGAGQQARELAAPNAMFAQPRPLQWLLGQKGQVSFRGPQLNTTTG